MMPNYWPCRSVLRWMSVFRNREIRNMVLLSTFGLLLTCYLFWISLYVWCVYDWKNYCMCYLYTQMSQIDCFRRVHKILRWIGSSDFIERLNVFSDEFHVLNANQAGFRKEYSTVDNLFSIHMLFELLRLKKSFIVCSLILRKCFIMSGEKHYGLSFYLIISIAKCMTLLIICTAKSSQELYIITKFPTFLTLEMVSDREKIFQLSCSPFTWLIFLIFQNC